jgi:hypothetical protein
MVGMTGPSPPNLACFSSLAMLYHADLHDLAAAVLWVGCAHKLGSPVPVLDMFEIQRLLKGTIPELAPVLWGKGSPPAISAQNVMYEGVQVLQLNRLVVWRPVHSNTSHERITLTRTGRAAILSGHIKAYLVR